MLLSSCCRIAAGRTLLSSTLRQLSSAVLGQESGSSCFKGVEQRSPSTLFSSSTSLSSPSTLLSSRRDLFTGPPSGSNSGADPDAASFSRKLHPTEEAESHSSVPEGATLAEEGERAAAGTGGVSPSSFPAPPPRRNKKTPLRPPSFDPIRTADALWPQSGAQRRVGRRVHRALQAILSQPRSATLPESVSRRLLGGGGGGGFGRGFFGGDENGNGDNDNGGCGLALAGARASPDGKSVFVLYDCSSGREDEARRALRAAAGPLRAAVSRVAGFKKVPKLVFVRDGEGQSFDGGGGGGGEGALPGEKKRRERSGGTVGEIEAEMARLGLLGGGGDEGEEGWSEEEGEEEKGDEGEGSREP